VGLYGYLMKLGLWKSSRCISHSSRRKEASRVKPSLLHQPHQCGVQDLGSLSLSVSSLFLVHLLHAQAFSSPRARTSLPAVPVCFRYALTFAYMLLGVFCDLEQRGKCSVSCRASAPLDLTWSLALITVYRTTHPSSDKQFNASCHGHGTIL